jgi:alpha-tubulin suppressor-like RCC1 family protein
MMKFTNQVRFGALALGALLSQGCSQIFKLNIKPTIALYKAPDFITADTQPSEYLDASKVILGDLALGSEKVTLNYGLKNTGDFPLIIQSITLSDSLQGQILIDSNCGNLAPNSAEVCPVSFTFDPKRVGKFEPNMIVTFKNHIDEIKTFTFPVDARGLAISVLKLKDGVGGSIPEGGLSVTGLVGATAPQKILFKVETNTDDFAGVEKATNFSPSFTAIGQSAFGISTDGLSDASGFPPCDLSTKEVSKDCFFFVTFNPSGTAPVSTGLKIGYFDSAAAQPGNPITITGSGTTNPVGITLSANPAALDLGVFTLGFISSKTANFSVNQGAGQTGEVKFASFPGAGPVSVGAADTSPCPQTANAVMSILPCNFKIVVAPTAATSGKATTSLTFSYQSVLSGVSTNKTISLPVSYDVKNRASLAFLDPVSGSEIISLSMGTPKVFTTVEKTVTVKNIGVAPAQIASQVSVEALNPAGSSPRITASFNSGCSSIAANATCTLKLTFAPDVAGAASQKFRIRFHPAGFLSPEPLPTTDDAFIDLVVSGTGDNSTTVNPPTTDGSGGPCPAGNICLGNVLLNGVDASIAGAPWGRGVLNFTGGGTLNFEGTHEAGSRFGFFGSSSFPGVFPSGVAGNNVPLCQPNFALSATNNKCAFVVGISNVASATGFVKDQTYSKELRVELTSSSASSIPASSFTLQAIPRDPSVLIYTTTAGGTAENPAVTFTPSVAVGKDSSPLNITLKLRSPSYFPIKVTGVSFSNSVFRSNYSATGCYATGLQPSNTNCVLSLIYRPGSAATETGTATITYNDGTATPKTIIVNLSGTGSNGNSLAMIPGSPVNFGTKYTVGPHFIDVTYTVTGLSVAGPLQVQWPTAGKGRFDYESNSSVSTCFNINPAIAGNVLNTAKCVIRFTYAPDPAAFGATSTNGVLIKFKNAISPIVTPVVDGYNGSFSMNLTGTFSKLNPTISLTGLTGSASPYTLAPFAEVTVNRDGGFTPEEKTITIQNAPNPAAPADPTKGPAKEFTFSFSGTAASLYSFASTTCPQTMGELAAGASCVVKVKFTPNAVVSGANAAASLSIGFKNNYNEAQTAISVNLSGSSVKPDPLSISPSVLAFGAKVLPAGGSVPVDAKDLTVSNTTTVAVPITAKALDFGNTLSIPGSPFSIDPDAAKSTCLAASVATSGLAPASSCKFSIKFSPPAEIKEHAASATLSYTDSAVSVPVTPSSKTLQLSGSVIQGLKIFANENQTCVITGTENAFCFGNNLNGSLGIGISGGSYPPLNTTLKAWAPTKQINFGSGARVKDINIGGSHTCAIIDYPALSRSGEATCWGSGAYGKLGKGNTQNFTSPELLGGSIAPIDFGPGVKVKQISAGESHTCALLSTNEVKCFGINISGVLGTGTATSSVIGDGPGEMGANLQRVAFNTASLPVHLSAGAGHNCVAFANGEARCWGSNFYGQLGQVMLGGYGSTPGTYQTGDVGSMANLNAIPVGFAVSKIYTGRNGRTCAVNSDGSSVKCFGKQSADADSSMTASSFAGLLGGRYCRNQNNMDVVLCGPTIPTFGIGGLAGDLGKIAPINFGSGEKVRELAVGRSFTCAILASNAVKCFGHDNQGQLGTDQTASGTITNLAIPGVAIPASTTEYPVKVAAGFDHACVVTNLNRVKCWGGASFNCTGTKSEPGYQNVIELPSAVAAPYVYLP